MMCRVLLLAPLLLSLLTHCFLANKQASVSPVSLTYHFKLILVDLSVLFANSHLQTEGLITSIANLE